MSTARSDAPPKSAVTHSSSATPGLEELVRAVRNAPVVLFALDQDGVVTFSEGSGLQSFGRTSGSNVGRSVFELYAAFPPILDDVRRALRGEEFWVERNIVDRMLATHFTPIRAPAGDVRGTIGISIDITETRAAENALEASQLQFRSITESAHDAIVVADQRGLIQVWNSAAERMFGYSAEEAIGQALTMIMPERYRAAHLRGFERVIEKGETRLIGTTVQIEGRRRDGGEFPLELSLAHWQTHRGFFFSGIMRDVTERTRVQEALVQSEAGFRALLEHSPDGIAVYRNGRFVYVNGSLANYLGYEQTQELEDVSLGIFGSDDAGLVASRLTEILAARTPQAVMERRIRRKDGNEVVAHVAATSVTFDGRPSVLLTLRDVTERRRMQAQLASADRMATVGTLAAGVAHEINNPLAALIGNLDLVTEQLREVDENEARTVSPAELRDLVSDARQAARQVQSIVRDIKRFSRIDEQERQPVDVRRALDSAIKLSSNELRHRAKLVRDYGVVASVLANEGRLAQVFLNLIVNAAQAFAPDASEHNEIRLSVRQTGSRVIIDVTDNGPGIAKENLDAIFEPFFTTKPIGIGTGLGLPICRGIVAAFGGDLTVTSEVGRFTTFHVSLPATTGARMSMLPTKPSVVPAPRGRVLVVDDDAMVGRVLRRSLSKEHDVSVVASGFDALRLLREGKQFDIVLCDLMMPEMGGPELHRRMKEAHPEHAARTVFLTGGAFTPEANDFLETIENERLSKPFDIAELQALVRAWVTQNTQGKA